MAGSLPEGPVRLAVLALMLAAVSLSGCSSERLLAKSGAQPTWISDVPEADDSHLLATGQAVGRNVLDEAEMRSRAMMDARRQLASRIATAVSVRASERLRETGYGPAGEDTVEEAEYRREVRTSAQERLVGVSLVGRYWEKWRINPGIFSRAFTRYRYHVLAAYPRQEYERQLDYYLRLVTDRLRAQELVAAGRPRQAADLLEDLLNDYPQESVRLRLTLARAYEKAQMLDRAVTVLEAALKLDPDEADAVRVRERIERLKAAFPDLSGRSATIRATGAADLSAESVRSWVEQAASRSNVVMGGESPGWRIEVEVRALAPEPVSRPYGLTVEKARAEATARVVRAADGALLASATDQERGYARTQPAAFHDAARRAVHRALRHCFLDLAGEGP